MNITSFLNQLWSPPTSVDVKQEIADSRAVDKVDNNVELGDGRQQGG